MMIFACYSALVRVHMESCVALLTPQFTRGINILETIQQRAVKVVKCTEYFSQEERLIQMGEEKASSNLMNEQK